MEDLTETIQIKKKFNVTIPKRIRRKMQLEVGQKVDVSIDGERIILKPLARNPAKRLAELIGSISAEQIREQAEKISIKEAKASLTRKLRQR